MSNLPPRIITVHAAATFARMDIGVRDIDQWHRARGWNGVGYHYVIRRDGTVEQGRPEHVVGAHVGGHNTRNLGICMAGGLADDGKTPQDNFTQAQYQTLNTLLDELLSRYPDAKIMGHNEFSNHRSRGCPCFDISTYRGWLTRARHALYRPSDWASYDWKQGLDRDWNEVNLYKEMPVVHTGEE